MANQNVQFIGVEDCILQQKINVVMEVGWKLMVLSQVVCNNLLWSGFER